MICSCSPKIEAYKNNEPKVDFRDFFSHNLVAHGTYFDMFGNASSRFIMKSSKSKVKDKEKTFYDQSIKYIETGEYKEMRSYAIFGNDYPNKFIYKDEMMVDEGVYSQSGNALNIKYKLIVGKKSTTVFCDDWAYMVDKDTLINKIKIKKFGITIGHIVMSIKKQK